MDITPEDKKKFDSEMERNPRLAEAYEMLKEGYTNTYIAKQMNVALPTIRKWFKLATLPPRTRKTEEDKIQEMAQKLKSEIDSGEDADDLLNRYNDIAVSEMKKIAAEEEDEAIAEIAAAQTTPADKYQHYIAAAGIKLLRDSVKTLRGPRSIRELSELDQIIRRNLGLNAKSGGGQSKLTIDISILNNSLADKGNGAISKMKKDVVEAEIVD